ncbi:MAG: GbsR/MarR family transcriptional regulator [Pseudomonadota bacterium]
MRLPPLQERFVMHFGEMGARWGVSRTVGQIYALLFVSDRPLCADDIVEALGFSRSNVSMGLKELQSWKLVRLRHLPDDRRDHFTTPEDIWEIVRTLAEQRKAREIDPTLTMLRELAMETPADPSEAHAQARMRETAEIIELLTDWYDEVKDVETERLKQLLALGAAIQKVIEMKDKIALFPKRGAAADAKDGAETKPAKRRER